MENQNQTQRFAVPTKLYRIGELVRYTPFSRQTIHNYTIMGLIQESEWTQGGHRLYDETVFAQLSRILELRKTMTLTQIQKILHEEKCSAESSCPGNSTGHVAGGAIAGSRFENN
jgi:DNA-binding transcriptional MerR regulator